MSSRTTLSAASEDRKARLAQLRSLKRKQPSQDDDAPPSDKATDDVVKATPQKENGEGDVTVKYLSGRNYDLETRTAKLGFEHAPDDAATTTLEKQAEAVAQRIKAEDEKASKDEALDLFKLQPKKPNWDLKRDLGQRMEVLDIKTENAIARLVRQRIEAQNKKDGEGGLEGADLMEALNVREKQEEDEQRRDRELDAI
jgi:coiled-coil domain-containing protein 12